LLPPPTKVNECEFVKEAVVVSLSEMFLFVKIRGGSIVSNEAVVLLQYLAFGAEDGGRWGSAAVEADVGRGAVEVAGIC